MTPATLTALAARLRDGQTVPTMEERAQAAAILEQVAGADAAPDFLSDTDVARIRRKVYGGPRFDTCEREFAAEIEAAVRAQFFAALTAQSGEGVALYEALKGLLNDPTGCPFCDSGKPRKSVRTGELCEHDEKCGYVLAHAAIAAYEAKRGGVR